MREELLKKYINKKQIGIEVGPLFWGLCRKDEGFNVLIWDVMSKEQLLEQYRRESMEAKKGIEEVDIVSSESIKIALEGYTKKKGALIKSVSESLDYIISSHNLEHMPNPVQFFIDASEMLKEGGVINLAIPIATRCFDCARPLSTTGEILDAYISKNEKPSLGEVFDHSFSTMSVINEKNEKIAINDLTFDFEKLTFNNELTYDSYKNLVDDYNNSPYKDSHVWQFNLESFISIFENLLACKIIKNLEIVDAEVMGIEFLISIRKTKTQKEFLTSNERRLNLKKESLAAYFSDLNKQNQNIITKNLSFEIINEESNVQKFKNQLIKRFYFFTKKILRKTLSDNKYQSLKSIIK